MENGRITRLIKDKKFGFIRHDITRGEFFFHASALKDGIEFGQLKEGQNVEFTIQVNSPRGPRADSVRVKV